MKWYGTVAVWAGSLLLGIMALSGHQIGIISAAAVLGIVLGIVIILASVPREAKKDDTGVRASDSEGRDATQ